jgi:hypothetical protein
MVVSHETTRQISGALHEETAYGKRKDKTFHVRKPLEVLKAGQIKSIVDPKLRKAVLGLVCTVDDDKNSEKDRLNDGINSEKDRLNDGINSEKDRLKDGVKIGDTTARRARIVARIKKAETLPVPKNDPTRFYQLGNNHHVVIFESPDDKSPDDEKRKGNKRRKGNKKREGRFVSMLEAAQRVRPRPDDQKRPLVDTTPPYPGWRFVMWLCKNDTVQMDGKLYRVQKLDPSGKRVYLMAATAGTVKNNSEQQGKAENSRGWTVNKLRCTKLEVDPIGRVREVPEGRL